MATTIDYNIDGKFVNVNTNHTDSRELEVIEDFYFEILLEIFLNCNITLITKTPQKYSFSKGMDKSCDLKVGDEKVLVTEIEDCEMNLLKSICQSEEFRRGFLLIVKSDLTLSNADIHWLLNFISDRRKYIVDTRLIRFVYCEDDGASICLYDTGLESEFLQGLIKQTLSKI